MVARGIETWGRLDVVVNNAGIVRDRAVWNMEVDDFDPVMRVHVRGTWLISRAVARHWRERAKPERPWPAGHQHDVGCGTVGKLRPDQLRHRQGGHHGSDPDAERRAGEHRVHRQRHRPGAVTRLSATTGLPDPTEPMDWDPTTGRSSTPA